MLRLETIAPDLVALIDRRDDIGRREAALIACRVAISRTGLSNLSVEALLGAIERGDVGETSSRRAVNVVVDALDGIQWELHDRLDEGTATTAEHLAAFARARAASAVYFAADSDARVAAMEALYEANAAIDDLDSLRSALAIG
ncbi:hypothetical protein ACWEOH_08340 [Agromyces sp. NPDC004153]